MLYIEYAIYIYATMHVAIDHFDAPQYSQFKAHLNKAARHYTHTYM